jgi:hypothetical protein
MPSPQVVWQELGVPLHDQPLSNVHVALQPSPLVVLPSSHASDPLMSPSPQMGVQVLVSPTTCVQE